MHIKITYTPVQLILYPIQKRYAAEDALVGIHILIALMEKLWTLDSATTPFLPKPLWQQRLSQAVHQACCGLLDIKFTSAKRNQDAGTIGFLF